MLIKVKLKRVPRTQFGRVPRHAFRGDKSAQFITTVARPKHKFKIIAFPLYNFQIYILHFQFSIHLCPRITE